MSVPLTGSEKEMLLWLTNGYSVSDISRMRKISLSTAQKYISDIRVKLECSTTAQAVARALREGIIE
jgi:DNA-binding CsgD family transcriptional regulator